MNQTEIKIKLGSWYIFNDSDLLFCGDTTSDEFGYYMSEMVLTLGIMSDEYNYDWLFNKAGNLVMVGESYLCKEMIERVVSVYSLEGDTIVFPWLPYEEMVAITCNLKRRVIAGDSDPEHCERAIAKVGVPIKELTTHWDSHSLYYFGKIVSPLWGIEEGK